MNKTEATKALSSTDGFFRHWMPYSQRVALTQALKGEESNYFVKLLSVLKEQIETMPKTYDTDGTGDNAAIHLHYFRGSVDAWITEKDVGDAADPFTQHQAFGKITLTGDKEDAEFGYISIQELIDNGVELDLHWTPMTLADLHD
jgi:hypothetical protein